MISQDGTFIRRRLAVPRKNASSSLLWYEPNPRYCERLIPKGAGEILQERVKQLQPYGNYTPTGPTVPQVHSIATVMLGASELTDAQRESLISPCLQSIELLSDKITDY